MDKGLLSLGRGDTGKIRLIEAGRNATRRLYEMGLNTGSEVKIIKNDAGPVILCLEGNKVAIGRGLAEKITIDV